MHDPASHSPLALAADALADRRAQLERELGDDAVAVGPMIDAWLATLAGADTTTTAPAAAALGVGVAQQSGDIAALAELLSGLRAGAIEALHHVGLDGDVAVVAAVHGALDRLATVSLAAFMCEREGEVLSMIAHDVSNPLMSAGLVIALLEERLGPEHRRSLETLARSTQQLRQLVADMQDAADVLAGAAPADAPADLVQLASEVVEQLAPAALARGVTLTAALPEGSAPVVGSPERLSRALAGLLRFVLRSTRPPKVVTLRGELDAAEVRLSLRDAGPGLPPSARARAFALALPTASPGRRKLNAELFLARGVIESHGGRVWIEPDPDGQGLAITLALPLAPR